MFSKSFGKNNPKENSAATVAKDSRGLEVIEDDPDTAWSRWNEALAEQDLRAAGVGAASAPPELAMGPSDAGLPDSEAPTVPLPLEEKSWEQRKNDALGIVESHHVRIANTIRTLWGYKECSLYINKLILAGDDGLGHARAGFHQEAAQAMLALAEVHDAMFGTFGQNDADTLDERPLHTRWDDAR